jgi:hypothetical protein
MTTHNKTVDKGSTATGKRVNLWPTYTVEPPADIPGRGPGWPPNKGCLTPPIYLEKHQEFSDKPSG